MVSNVMKHTKEGNKKFSPAQTHYRENLVGKDVSQWEN